MKTIGIYGCGALGRHVSWILRSLEMNRDHSLVFLDDSEDKKGSLDGLDIKSPKEFFSDSESNSLVWGIGSPTARRSVFERIKSYEPSFLTLVHPSATVSDRVQIGKGVIIGAGSVISTDIEIADHVVINVNCSILHDTRIGRFSTLSPGVNIAGNVSMADAVFMGIGSTVINGTKSNPITLGDGSTIGAGACVVENIEAGATVVGVPAKPI